MAFIKVIDDKPISCTCSLPYRLLNVFKFRSACFAILSISFLHHPPLRRFNFSRLLSRFAHALSMPSLPLRLPLHLLPVLLSPPSAGSFIFSLSFYNPSCFPRFLRSRITFQIIGQVFCCGPSSKSRSRKYVTLFPPSLGAIFFKYRQPLTAALLRLAAAEIVFQLDE